jgi:hypothetical protein
MTIAAEFPTKVVNGKLPAGVLHSLMDAAAKLDGKAVIISIKEPKRIRSNNQNSYYFGVVVKAVTKMFRDAGNYVDEDEVHEFLKMHVGKLSQNVVTPDGEILKAPASSKRLSTMEFEVYLEKIRAWAAEYGCSIPLPHEILTTEDK